MYSFKINNYIFITYKKHTTIISNFGANRANLKIQKNVSIKNMFKLHLNKNNANLL